MAQISIDTLHGEGVIFVVNIEDMLPRKDDIQISRVPICTIPFRIRGCALLSSIAIIRIPGKSSGVQSAHGRVVVLGGRQPACVLRLALRALSSPPFLS